MNLYFDIETIPAQENQHGILKEIHAKKKADGKKVESNFDQYLAATSFDGAFGQIICIGYAKDDKPVEVLKGDEKQILKDFWAIAENARLFIGFNNMDFDLRFIYQRSIVCGEKPSVDLSFARYRNNPIYDIMHEWNKWDLRSHISLDGLAKALGIPSSKGGEIEGKDVARAYTDGRIKEICDYCKKDVEVTRAIYRKMVFAQPQQLPF
ncbi:MAG: ribonuclease H-like domain-containing protein [Candidatus Curtissbacteria bacterium]|nr:ribonuclease H-like domain-containing protein [Candidatus Curtissbacteria bacterium]